MMRPTIRLRLTAAYASLFLLGGGSLLAVSYVIVNHENSSFPDRVAAQMSRHGVSLTPSPAAGRYTPATRQATAGAGARNRTTGTPQGTSPLPKPIRAYLAKLNRAQAAAQQVVRQQTHRQVALEFALALMTTTLLSLLAGWFLAGRALKPVRRITATAQRVAAGADLSERIRPKGPADELRELAETFDRMLERLDHTFTSQRSFIANASHELRTPLAIIRAEIEERLDDPQAGEPELRDMAAVVHEAVQRSENLIAGLLTLARSQSELHRHEHVEVGELVSTVARRLEPELTRRRITIALSMHEAATVAGDRQLLEQLIANLLDNATRYNHQDGFVRVMVDSHQGTVRLEVSNSGPTISTEIAPRLFEPFFRDDSRSRDTGGAGLGLAIVAAITSAHGGEATATARHAGGLGITITLPASPTSDLGKTPNLAELTSHSAAPLSDAPHEPG